MRRGKITMDDLPDALGTAEILEPVRPEVSQGHAVRQAVDDQPGGCVRHENLVSVADRTQTSASDHGLTEVVAFVAQLCVAGVDRHAHVELRTWRPVLGHEGSLGIDRRGHRIRRTGKRGHHAVALSLLDRPHAAVAGDDLVQDLVVPGNRHGHRCGRAFPPLRRSLHVGQQKADRSRR